MDDFVTSTDDQGTRWHFKRGMMDVFRRPRTRYRLIWREGELWIVGVMEDGTLNLPTIERLAVWVAYKGFIHPANFFPDGKGGFKEEPLYLGCKMKDCSWPKCHLRICSFTLWGIPQTRQECPILKGLI